ncbi:MAG: GNAT family N-acetyltransferase [Nanoarchaeota archaeon]|nr:GNAT family N-acetyltransferase [Nanoarchaeota archaeon]
MRIRKIKRNELRKTSELMLEVFSKSPFNEECPIEDVIESLEFYYKNAEIYIAYSDSIEGVIVFQIEKWWEGNVLIVQDLAVRKNSQRKNIGRLLMNFLDEFSKKKEIKKIIFGTHRDSDSVDFYKKLGYKINRNGIVMEKIL